MDHVSLKRVVATWPPKTLKPFVDKASSVVATLAKVEAKNSPHKGRNFVVYDNKMIETIISAYVVASGHNALQKNQLHYGVIISWYCFLSDIRYTDFICYLEIK